MKTVMEKEAQSCPQKWLTNPEHEMQILRFPCFLNHMRRWEGVVDVHYSLWHMNLDLNLVHKGNHRRPFFQVGKNLGSGVDIGQT